jgi:large subunit ribosomal protein L24
MLRQGETATKLKKNDVVKIIKGKDRGKSGRILRIDHEKMRLIVEGLNIMKKAIKPKKQNDKGGIKELERSMAIGNVMIVCKKCGPTRIGSKVSEKQKARICRKCGEQL